MRLALELHGMTAFLPPEKSAGGDAVAVQL
jgi:hypothetical protein